MISILFFQKRVHDFLFALSIFRSFSSAAAANSAAVVIEGEYVFNKY